MKNFSVFSFAALFVIFTISVSVVKCDDDEESDCLVLNNICKSHEFCCSKYCGFVSELDQYVCMKNQTNDSEEDFKHGKVQHGSCSFIRYDNQLDEETKQLITSKFTEFHAAHALIPTGTRVIVRANDMKVTVVIDNRIPTKGSNTSNLELSENAAEALNIWKEGVVPCDLQVETTSPTRYGYLWKPLVVVTVYIAAIVLTTYW